MTETRPSDLFQPGDIVNNTYKIEKILGRGGTSDVYRARSEISGRLVAIKVLKAEFSGNDDYLSLLTREEEIREIRHDAVVRYSENHRTPDGHVYLLMDFVDGPGLDKMLKEAPLPADDLLVICRRVAEGLQAAHARNIVHRDLSPDNIILRDSDPAQAVIIDFGIAKDANPGAETIVGNEFAGKYAYAAPEQLSGKTDKRTDIYSLGALLLACFRGESPKIGKNPMEVIENKSKVLDMTGVPEPLRGLLTKMTQPDPDGRFGSIEDVLSELTRIEAVGQDDENTLEDKTVIAPIPRPAQNAAAAEDAPHTDVPQSEPPQPAAPASDMADDTDILAAITGEPSSPEPPLDESTLPPPPKPKPPAKEKRKSGGLVPILAGLALVLGGAGAYFSGALDGLIAPAYETVSPFELTVAKPASAPLSVSGFVPGEQMQQSLVQFAERAGGSAQVSLASGAIPDSWASDVMALIDIATPLDQWRIVVSDSAVTMTGNTSDRTVYDSVTAALADGMPGALTGTPRIDLVAQFLPVAALNPILSQVADCGPLELAETPPAGFATSDEITVRGTLSSDAVRNALKQALTAFAAPRPVTIDVEVLNPKLCLVETNLPKAPSGGIDIAFSEGEELVDVPDGVFTVGQNPVIDVLLPADMTDGYLFVSIIDVTGNVFHLLPNLGRPDNAVANLRNGQTGQVPITVAFSVLDAFDGPKLAFRVDDSTLGTSKVLVIHADGPLFSEMRPTTESVAGYAQALRDQQRSSSTRIHSLDSRLLVTQAQ